MNALGELKDMQSNNLRALLTLAALFFRIIINQAKTKDLFITSLRENIGILSLTEFLHPLIDEEYPIQINLHQKIFRSSKIFSFASNYYKARH